MLLGVLMLGLRRDMLARNEVLHRTHGLQNKRKGGQREEERGEMVKNGKTKSCAPIGPETDRACFESHALRNGLSLPGANCTAVML
jgi:hypothetical protein